MTMSGAGHPMCRHTRKADCTWWCAYHRLVWLLLGIAVLFGALVGILAVLDPAEAARKLGQLALALPAFLVVVWIASMIFPSHDRAVEWRPDAERSGRRTHRR